MITNTAKGDILKSDAKHIAFSINAEGVVGGGFDGVVIQKGWPELLKPGKNPIGTVFSKEIDGVVFHALVTHSLEAGWGTPEEQWENTRLCFDNIPVPDEEEISSIAIGTGFMGSISGASPKHIVCGMCDSKKNIKIFGFSMEAIKQVYAEESAKRVKPSQPGEE